MVTPLPLLTLLTLARLTPTWAAPAPAPTDWVVDHADVTVHIHAAPDSGEAAADPTIDLTYTFRRVGRHWATLRLCDNVVASATTGPLTPEGEAEFVTLDPAKDTVVTTVSGVLAADGPDHVAVHLPEGARTLVHIDAPGLDVTAAGSLPANAGARTSAEVDALRILPADGTLDLTWQPHQAEVAEVEGTVVRAEVSTAAWPQDGALNVRSRVRFVVTRGTAESFSIDTGGLDEVEATGPFEHTLTGTTLTFTPASAVSGAVTFEFTGRRPTINGQFPSPAPLDVSRVETWYTLGKPDEGDVVPSGGTAVSARQLPVWARGLSEATPVAYWSAAPSLTAGSFDTVMGPDTIVQSAEYVVSQSEDGHVLARATWLVRNERSQYLKVTPPKGYTPLTARVSGRPAVLLHEGDDYYVPLEKSIETVQGLLAFPVEVAWVGDDTVWSGARHDKRDLKLPAVNAPIQAATWEVHLPRGWRQDGKRPGGPVGSPVSSTAVLDPAKEQARESWTNAIDAYKKNDFDSAQKWLDASRSYAGQSTAPDAATMDNVGRLQSNLDVLIPKAPPQDAGAAAANPQAGDDVLARRVKDLANAKTTDAQIAQSNLEEDARKALLAGDDEKATEALKQVTALAKDIGVTEQTESTEQSDKVAEYSQTLSDAEARVEKKKSKSAYGNGFGNGDGKEMAGKAGLLGSIGTRGTGEGGGGQGYGSNGPGGTDEGRMGGVENGVEGGVLGGDVSGSVGGEVATQKGEVLVVKGEAITGVAGDGNADADGVADDYGAANNAPSGGPVVDQTIDVAPAAAAPGPKELDEKDAGGDSTGNLRGDELNGSLHEAPEAKPADYQIDYLEAPAHHATGAASNEYRGSTRSRAGGKSASAPQPVVAQRSITVGAKAPSPDAEPAPMADEPAPGPTPVAAAPRPPPASPQASPQATPPAQAVARSTVATTTPAPTTRAASAADENTILLDGVNTTDPNTGTFSMNFNYDAIQQIDESKDNGKAANAEEESSTTKDTLVRIPTGRTYQTALGAAAGVVATPAPTVPMPSGAFGVPKTALPPSSPYATRQPPKPAPRGPATIVSSDTAYDLPQGGAPAYRDEDTPYFNPQTDGFMAPPPPPPPPAYERDRAKADEEKGKDEDKKRQLVAKQSAKVKHLQAVSRTKANAHNGPDTRVRMNPLEVSASPLTPALPLDGALLTHSAALLNPDEFPSFTYTVSPDPRSLHSKE